MLACAVPILLRTGPTMVPYIDIPDLPLGLRAFDLLVALAVVVGVITAERRAAALGLSRRVIMDVTLWALIPGFITSHLVSIVFYFPERLAENPLELLNIFSGMSSFGGFLGGAAGVIFCLRRHKIPVWEYSEPLVYGILCAWVWGRLGCTVAHDHPGVHTDFFLAVNYPDGPRHDLGFYELLWTLAVVAFCWLRRREPRFTGWTLGVFLLTYTPCRLAGDFLRGPQDPRYLGLTAAQYICVALFLVGVWVWVSRRRRGHMIVADGQIHIFEDGTPARSDTPAQ